MNDNPWILHITNHCPSPVKKWHRVDLRFEDRHGNSRYIHNQPSAGTEWDNTRRDQDSAIVAYRIHQPLIKINDPVIVIDPHSRFFNTVGVACACDPKGRWYVSFHESGDPHAHLFKPECLSLTISRHSSNEPEMTGIMWGSASSDFDSAKLLTRVRCVDEDDARQQLVEWIINNQQFYANYWLTIVPRPTKLSITLTIPK